MAEQEQAGAGGQAGGTQEYVPVHAIAWATLAKSVAALPCQSLGRCRSMEVEGRSVLIVLLLNGEHQPQGHSTGDAAPSAR